VTTGRGSISWVLRAGRAGGWGGIDERTGQWNGGVRVDKACGTPSAGNDDGEVTRLPPLRRDFLRSSGAV
jgi:hypothetical protein